MWHYTSKIALKKLWKKVFDCAPHNHISIVNERIYEVMASCGQNQAGKGLHDVAELYGIETPDPQHCAKNDVSVLRKVKKKRGL